jgi:hypothetical protein
MSQKIFKHRYVEDYIEIIAGYREPNGKSNYNIFTVGEPLISLARYDTKVVPSLAEQTLGQTKGYTDRQATLATSLIIKYERQLAKHGIDITPVRTPEYRLPLRALDRSTRLWIENNQIKLRFPYDTKLIEVIRTASKESKGAFQFNRNEKIHIAELTEWNLNWIYSFALQNKFDIDSSVTDLMKLVLDVEKTDYSIQLNYTEDGIEIVNAEDSLVEYVNTQGGFKLENILTLCDMAPVLGYTVDRQIEQDVIANFGTRFWSLCANRQLKVDVNANLIPEVINYAQLTNRFPIFIYEPDLSDRLKTEFSKYFSNSMIVMTNYLATIPEDVKVVYTTKIPKTPIDRIPLMISSAGMLYGGDRQMWIQAAEKVVYFSKDVYNKSVKGQDVCKLN